MLSPVMSERNFASHDNMSLSEGWFRREDLNQFSKPWLVFQAVLGGLIGYAASALILLYAILNNFELLPLFVPGITASTILLAGTGLLRNRVLRYVAARGFKTTFHFQSTTFAFYLVAIASGAIGIGYGYGYVSPQSTSLVLPFAGLFILFIYLNVLWAKILVRSEEGRLCIFQFLVEHNLNGRGYSWLKRGLIVVEGKLPSFGVGIKRHSLYFGASYSLLEGSYLDWDLDSIYLLGDWTSQPDDLRAVHDAVSWFLYRSKSAEKRGFSRVFSLLDRLLEISPQSLYYIIAAMGVLAGIVIAVLRH